MTLKEHIEDIRDNLGKGFFTNEAAVSQGIVLRLLDALAWPRYNTQVIIPEYSVEGRRVDFALCHPLSKPIVFVEVKQVGNIDGAERQLFEYAFHVGVPIAILTDGQKWRFFYPIGQGDYRERKVHEIDLTEDDSEESAKKLNRYLNYESIRTGEAVEAIKKDYEKVVQQRQVATRLPEAWSKLVEKADEFLLDVVAEKTETLCGYRPTNEQVLDFLKSLERKPKSELIEVHSPPISPMQPAPRHGIRKQKASQTRLVVTMPNGEVIEYHKATDTWFQTILTLGPDKVIEVDDNVQIISTSSNFRPGRPETKHGQYYIAMDYSTSRKKELLERIASRLGVQLKVEIVDKS